MNYPDGQLNYIEGYAFRPVEAEKGKLKVIFGSLPQPSNEGNCKKMDFTFYVHTYILYLTML